MLRSRIRPGSPSRAIPVIFPSLMVNVKTASGWPPCAHTAAGTPSTRASTILDSSGPGRPAQSTTALKPLAVGENRRAINEVLWASLDRGWVADDDSPPQERSPKRL